MSYRHELQDLAANWKVAPGLLDHLNSPKLDDISIKYVPALIEETEKIYTPKIITPAKVDNIRLPARLNNPLEPYPLELKQAYIDDVPISGNTWHSHHQRDVKNIISSKIRMSEVLGLASTNIKFDVPSLKKMTKCQFSDKADIINLTALEFARRATSHDISIAAMEEIKVQPRTRMSSPYLSFLIAMQRMRILLCSKVKETALEKIEDQSKSPEVKVNIYSNATYVQHKYNDDQVHCLIVAGGHFAIYHSDVNYWFIGPFAYLDYALTLSDTINNLELLSYDDTYAWAKPFFGTLIELAESDAHHNTIVNFMKSFEGFILNMSDYDEEFPMNWVPIMEGLYDLWNYDQIFSSVKYEFAYLPALLHNGLMSFPKNSYLCRFISILKKLDRTQLQEISSLHKFVFYSEVDSEAGVRKFLQRVHTVRPVDFHANRAITQLAKQEFVISYTRKHNSLPTIHATTEKLTVLKIHFTGNKMDKLKEFPLAWWTDVKPWSCMDSTLTDDALEFAKDKGALKKEFRCGPGDSRKELLQLIEAPDYKLKDLMANGRFQRSKASVVRTTQAVNAIDHKHPARLIPKEREQKDAARLYANGELSNKHALSVITTKMKKVLAYFDEQLMTPSDSQRKLLLHRIGQTLREPDKFSLLLDIEGHNQSMQAANTSELLEFIGNIYGEVGWGSLADYFGALMVYYYDEYKDDVIISQGQHGGIEGWMNPVWTLHTLLMMKLLRLHTDLDIPDLMVYSDDVNAVIKLTQPTEATLQSVFSKIMKHCIKFGMVAKFSQTTLSKHRATMLRQHYSEGFRADSTLKRLMAVSGANNPMVASEELEIAGICSSTASALEFSNHSETCCYLKNYKIGILLARLPQMILSVPQHSGMLSSDALPSSLAELLYHIKDDNSLFKPDQRAAIGEAALNDVARYLKMNKRMVNASTLSLGVQEYFSLSVGKERYVDSPDRMLYLQIYDDFIKDLLFFWTYLPTSLGGLGGIIHLDMILSGHSNGFSKAVHYLHQWIAKYASNKKYFLDYLSTVLSNSKSARKEEDEWEILTAKWPSEVTITSASSTLSSSIRSFVKRRSANRNVLKLFELSDKMPIVAKEIVKIFKKNYHPRIAQFYYENSSVHFLDLLVNKIETSSGLLGEIRNLSKIRFNLARRTITNIRIASNPRATSYGVITEDTDIVNYLMTRRATDFPGIDFIQAEEILYDDKLAITLSPHPIVTVRKCSPLYYKDGRQVYSDPKIGDEVLYKGDYLDKERMVGNKEELLAARVVSVTMWLLTKTGNLGSTEDILSTYDCAQACNLTLKTLTGQTLIELMPYCPMETGGEILHRIPNMRFSSNTYIRAEMNLALSFVAELSQRVINNEALIDSNINFDYLRMRLICSALIKSKYAKHASVLTRYELKNLSGVCDVQFVSPKPLDWISDVKFQPYSEFRKHEFSYMRFRFLATSYLSVENIEDLALFPKQELDETMSGFGRSLKRELVYKYARAMDKEYMSASVQHPREDVWKAVYYKLGVLDPKFKELTDNEKYDESISLLRDELQSRNFTRVLSSSNKSDILLQSECLAELALERPDDQVYQTLLSNYLLVTKQNTAKKPIIERIKIFNRLLATQELHKANLCEALICEIILTLHFHTFVLDGVRSLDAQTSLDQFSDVGIVNHYLQSVNPELQAQVRILGSRTIWQHFLENKDKIKEYLFNLSLTTSVTDVSLPVMKLSVKSTTDLTKEIDVPDASESVIYMSEELGDKSMSSIKDIIPLAKYADMCCDFGSQPGVFESPTGSDTFCAQYGFFKLLISQFGLTSDSRVCDLTAGRGDGLYAAEQLGLTFESFSSLDTFTSTCHHPNLNFSSEYDITKSDTLDFITGYDFVHVDVSFLRDGKTEVGDLLLYLESNSLPYSIRLNSITLDVYATCIGESISSYQHHLSYCVSGIWRTPQIYLIGIPGPSNKALAGIALKESVAFRAMAVSYTELLKKPFTNQLLPDMQLNSMSICLPENSRLTNYMKYLCDNTIADERFYYLRRFRTEFSSDALIYIVPESMPPETHKALEEYISTGELVAERIYSQYSENDIGAVSVKSFPYHAAHLTSLQDPLTLKLKVDLSVKDKDLLCILRKSHPLRAVRSLCNVILGLLRLCPEIEDLTPESIEDAITRSGKDYYVKMSRHQEELATAMKLLLLSVHYGRPTLGLIYCSLMSQNYPSKASYMRRVRKRYKLLSGYRPYMHNQLQAGNVRVQSLLVMADDLFIKRPNQFKQAKKYTDIEPDNEAYRAIREGLVIDFEKVFKSFETHAMIEAPELAEWPAGDTGTMDVITAEVEQFNITANNGLQNLTFNIDIGAQVDMWAAATGAEINPLTGTYYGFENEFADEGDYEEGEW
nr:MAG: RNA-dependent RNA polymerase [Sclerotinia sclerotiorum ophiovirus like virus 1]